MGQRGNIQRMCLRVDGEGIHISPPGDGAFRHPVEHDRLQEHYRVLRGLTVRGRGVEEGFPDSRRGHHQRRPSRG